LVEWSRLGLGAASVAAQYIVTHPQPSHNPINFGFLLDPLSKNEFLFFYGYGSHPSFSVQAGNQGDVIDSFFAQCCRTKVREDC